MNKLPHLNWKEPPPWQKERLSRWLDQWRLDRILDESASAAADPGSPPATQERLGIKQRIAPFDLAGEPVGQIRLLGNNLLPGSPRPVYVALFHPWEKDMVLMAPYSPFTEPAVPGELLTGRPDASLSVLCLWNAHSIHTELLRESWFIDQLSNQEREEAFAVFCQATTGKPLPPALVERVGPPLSHPRDPRRKYQEQELDLLAPLARTIREIEEGQAILAAILENGVSESIIVPWIVENAPLAMAAASQGPEASRAVIYDGSISMFMEAAKTAIELRDGISFSAPILAEPESNPESPEETEAQWDMQEGIHHLPNGGTFLVFDGSHKQFIGSGTIIKEGGLAHLERGKWQHFATLNSRWSQLILIIFRRL